MEWLALIKYILELVSISLVAIMTFFHFVLGSFSWHARHSKKLSMGGMFYDMVNVILIGMVAIYIFYRLEAPLQFENLTWQNMHYTTHVWKISMLILIGMNVIFAVTYLLPKFKCMHRFLFEE